MLLRHLSFSVVFAAIGMGCGPDSGDPPNDASWVVGRYLGGCGEDLATCIANNLYELTFAEDGTVASVRVECGVRKAQTVEGQARWEATAEDGVVELFPVDDREAFTLISGGVTEAVVKRRDDCLKSDVQTTEGVSDPPDIYDYVIHRGDFRYDVTICATTPHYLTGTAPECDPES